MSYSILNEAPKPVRTLRSDVPVEVERLIEKTLSKDPNERYQTSTELTGALQSLKKRIESSRLDVAEAGRSDAKGRRSIAVLPFVNMSADPENEYFSDGLAEDLINALTKIRDLRVAARTSAFSFKGAKTDVREIGRKLNVETVMEGSVRKVGDRLRITAQLIDVADGYHVWSEQYDRMMKDIFEIQDEITTAIVQKLKMQLVPEERSVLMTPQTDSLEAYNLYLKGRYFWNKRTVAALESSITCFEQAVQEDPNYALAHVGLADAYILLAYSSYGAMNPRLAYPKAKEAVLKALEIDETLAEAHTSLAMILCSYDWDWGAAEREFKQAIALNPNYASTHHWYAIQLAQMGRHAEAELEIRTARQLDPFSLIVNAVAGLLLFLRGEYDRAVSDLQDTLKLEPNFWHAHLYLGYAYSAKGLHEKAIECVERATVLSGHATYPTSMLGSFHALNGDVTKAMEILHRLEERAKKSYVPPFYFSNIYYGLGDLDATFSCIERALQDHDPAVLFFKNWPLLSERFRSDPRFVKMLKRIGLRS
jgi:TolB-like protein/Flp pilus assembly protein TadD